MVSFFVMYCYLYKKMKFKDVGKRKNFYENPREDAILMTYKPDGEI